MVKLCKVCGQPWGHRVDPELELKRLKKVEL